MKKELIAFSELVRHLSGLFSSERYITISVVLQNMAFHADEFKESEFEPYLRALKLFKECRPDCHISNWVYEEADMIISGHFMSEFDLERDYFEQQEG